MITYFEIKWAEKEGTERSLGIQAAIVGAAVVVFVLPLQIWGKKMRVWQGKIEV